ncbi:MAG TPA: SDR family oxidoreductase [Rhodocyclaceae bacterium]|nr:SDR family oxidoreductase [Rhodocyclaceae bacterium]
MKVAVITGSSRGIGLATAHRFATAGYRVIGLSRQRGGFEGPWLTTDLSRSDGVAAITDALIDEIQGADQLVLVHNAATLISDDIADSDDQMLQQVFQTNLIAPIQLNRVLLPWSTPGSSILYIGSTLSEIAAPMSLSYVTSKHGSLGLMRATAIEIAGRGMHSVCICPGVTDTEMARDHFGGAANLEGFVKTRVLLKRAVTPEEIAEVVFFCAGNPALNGQVIHANLGQAG